MATLRIVVLKNDKKQDGTYPVNIRLTHQKISKYIQTKYYVTNKQINKKFEIIDSFLLRRIEEIIKRYREAIISLGDNIETYSSSDLKTYLTKEKENNDIDFIKYGREKVKELKEKEKKGAASILNTTMNNFSSFTETDSYSIQNITVSFLNNYYEWLKLKLGENGGSLYLRNIRTLFNDAIKEFNDEEKGIIRIKHYPFKFFSIPDPGTKTNRNFEIETIKKIRDLKDSEFNRINLARDIFMLSFYMLGVNVADIYNFERITNGRVVFNRTKTKDRRKDHAETSIKVQPEAMEIIKKYLDEPRTGYLMKFHSMYANFVNFRRAINTGLGKIEEEIKVPEITTYYARHSVATLLWKQGLDLDSIGQALAHAEKKDVVNRYVGKDYSKIDKANRKLLDSLKDKVKKERKKKVIS